MEIYAGDELIWSGETEKSLGYIHLNVKPVLTNEITIRLKGASKEGDGFGQIVEVAAPAAGELDLFKAKMAIRLITSYVLLKLSLKRICGNRDVDIF